MTLGPVSKLIQSILVIYIEETWLLRYTVPTSPLKARAVKCLFAICGFIVSIDMETDMVDAQAERSGK